MIGFVVTSIMSSMVLSLEDMSTSSMSGFPFAVESHRKIPTCRQTDTLSVLIDGRFSAISPVMPLCAQLLSQGASFQAAWSLPSYVGYGKMGSGMVFEALHFSSVEYGNSTSCPPYSFSTFRASSRTVFWKPSFSHHRGPGMSDGIFLNFPHSSAYPGQLPYVPQRCLKGCFFFAPPEVWGISYNLQRLRLKAPLW